MVRVSGSKETGMGISGDLIMNIDQMRDVLAEDEVEYIQSLSSRNLLHYVKDEIISKYSDEEVKEEHRRILLEL